MIIFQCHFFVIIVANADSQKNLRRQVVAKLVSQVDAEKAQINLSRVKFRADAKISALDVKMIRFICLGSA